MSFWSFIGEVALFNMICNWFSGKPKHSAPDAVKTYHYRDSAQIEELNRRIRDAEMKRDEYRSKMDEMAAASVKDYDIDDLQDRIDKLESELDEYEEGSEAYDSMQDEIDNLQTTLDDMEYNEDLYDDLQDELDDLEDELDNLEDELDDIEYGFDDSDYLYDDKSYLFADDPDDW